MITNIAAFIPCNLGLFVGRCGVEPLLTEAFNSMRSLARRAALVGLCVLPRHHDGEGEVNIKMTENQQNSISGMQGVEPCAAMGGLRNKKHNR